MKFFIHIGTNKTGTSSFQDFLIKNPENLSNHGWLYPSAGRNGDVAHHYLLELMDNRPEDLRSFVDDCVREADGLKGVILSSEALHIASSNGVSALSKALEGHDVKVVTFVRDHIDYLSSWYREDVQTTNICCDFPSYGVLKKKNYSSFLRVWQSAFGNDSLIVKGYDRNEFLNKSLVDEIFINLLNVSSVEGWGRDCWDQNPSISGNLLFLKRIVNNYISNEESLLIRDEITELAKLSESYRRPMYISKELTAYLSSFYEEDRKALSNEFGVDLLPCIESRGSSTVPSLASLKNDYFKILTEAEDKKYKFSYYLKLAFMKDDI